MQVFKVKISKSRCVLLIFIMYKHRADFCPKGIFLLLQTKLHVSKYYMPVERTENTVYLSTMAN